MKIKDSARRTVETVAVAYYRPSWISPIHAGDNVHHRDVHTCINVHDRVENSFPPVHLRTRQKYGISRTRFPSGGRKAADSSRCRARNKTGILSKFFRDTTRFLICSWTFSFFNVCRWFKKKETNWKRVERKNDDHVYRIECDRN